MLHEKAEIEDDRTIFIGNLGYGTTEEILSRFFSSIGPVRTVRVVRNDDGRPKGVAFVEFATKSDAVAAVKKYDRKNIDGRICFLKLASDPLTPPEKRNKTRGKARVLPPPPFPGDRYNPIYPRHIEEHSYPNPDDDDQVTPPQPQAPEQTLYTQNQPVFDYNRDYPPHGSYQQPTDPSFQQYPPQYGRYPGPVYGQPMMQAPNPAPPQMPYANPQQRGGYMGYDSYNLPTPNQYTNYPTYQQNYYQRPY